MKTAKEIRAEIERLEKDERYQACAATIVENAPLALIQVEIESHIRALRWVLEE